MAPSRRKGASKAAAAAAARRQWKVGDLVLAKVKGFPAWPATVSEPEKWGYSTDWKKVLVYFFGTQQIAFCNPADVEAFTEEKKQALLVKRQGKGADFVRAVQEIIDSYEKLKETQVDITNSDEVSGVNVTIPVDSSAKSSSTLGLKDETQAHDLVNNSQINTLNSFTDQPETTYAAEEVLAVAPKDESSSKEISSKELTDNAGATAKSPYPVTYSSRKRSMDLRPQGNTTQRNAPVRKSRSSSRIQSFVMPCSDGGKSAADGLASAVQNVSLRRNKRSRKSPDISECDDVDPSAFVSNDSMEDNRSEILTIDSDPLSLNEGSTLDSNCKVELFETIECPEGEFELNKGFDELNTLVKKKKRKPNRKRLTDDSAKQTTMLEEEACVLNSGERSQNVCENPKDRCSKQDSDEHLPLLKRARVRMGKSSATDVEQNSIIESQDKRSEENSINSFQHINMSSTHDNLSAAEGDLSVSNIVVDNVSPPKYLAPCSESVSQICKIKDQAFSCSVDGEAALPPSKRLHRALEAMSANAAEDGDGEDRVELSHTTMTSNSRSCTSSINRCPCTAINSQGEDDIEMLGMGTFGVDSSHFKACSFSTSLNPVICNPTENKLSLEMDKQMTELRCREICKDVLPDGNGKEVGKDLTDSVVCQTDGSDAQIHLLGNLAPNTEMKFCEIGSSQDLSGPLLSSNDESNVKAADVSNKASGLSEHIGTGHDPASGANESGEFSTQNFTDVRQNEVPENTGCLKVAVDSSKSNVNDMCEAVKEVACKGSKEDMNSVSICDDCFGEKDIIGLQPSPSLTDGADCLPQGSPPNTSFCNVSTSDSSNILQNNGSCSPDVHLHQKHTFSGPICDGKVDGFATTQRSKNKSTEAGHAALLYFEATLGTLTRTKESIGRATRIAIDCAKFGSAAKVVEILAHNLETESSLHRRVDLFFLVDSIAQCSRGLKGDVGGVYPSAIQAVLPRLLSAAAPPGNTAQENRRQCLKVLRLWLERRILSESIIRHHIRELDSYGVSASAGAFSRRSLRTERALDDPVREMEGMLVDEYGSNSSFQLPGFCMPRMLKCEDEGSDSDGGKFEAVTPERDSDVCEMTPALEKHRHILEDVDGELEMEDVAPCCDVEMNSVLDVNGGNKDATQVSNCVSNNLVEKSIPVSFVRPLPQDVPPSSPPLPLSSPPPPPPPPPPQHPSLPVMPVISHPCSTGVISKLHKDAQIVKGKSLPSMSEPLGAPRDNQPLHEVVHYRVPECRDMPMQLPESTTSFSSYPLPPDNFHYFDGATVLSKGYPLRPPHQVPSNQFSFVQGDQHMKPRREVPPPSYSNKHHSMQNMERENFRNNHDRLKPPSYDFRERWRVPAPYSGSRYQDRGAPTPYGCHPCESARLPDHGWRFPPRSMNHRNSMPFRQPFEDAIPMASRGPGFWRPR
ncbi:protein HUA2-LIKE 2 [Prosopis cineraria]|uniref:protein HUA2-LIKE 2 n=1 Tax=Prosopis cineraria TaxID=364024 RepID=UPI00240EFD81|nr:protein HUA2-LIKE 2 [Prosopis cineraria]